MIKKIEAIIRSEKLNSTMKELSDIGIVGLTVQPVKGRGRGAGVQLQWRGNSYNVGLLPRTMISIILSEEKRRGDGSGHPQRGRHRQTRGWCDPCFSGRQHRAHQHRRDRPRGDQLSGRHRYAQENGSLS